METVTGLENVSSTHENDKNQRMDCVVDTAAPCSLFTKVKQETRAQRSNDSSKNDSFNKDNCSFEDNYVTVKENNEKVIDGKLFNGETVPNDELLDFENIKEIENYDVLENVQRSNNHQNNQETPKPQVQTCNQLQQKQPNRNKVVVIVPTHHNKNECFKRIKLN